MRRPALEKISKKDPRFARRLAFAFDYPDVVLQQPMPPPKPIPDRAYANWLAPGYLQKGYGGTKEWPFDFAMAVRKEGYRRGIVRAIANKRDYNWEWRKEAALWIQEVEEVLRELEDYAKKPSELWKKYNF